MISEFRRGQGPHSRSSLHPGHSFSRILCCLMGSPWERELSDRAKSLALNIFQVYDCHISTKLLFRHAKYISLGEFETCFPFGGLYNAHHSSELLRLWRPRKRWSVMTQMKGFFGGIRHLLGLLIMGIPKWWKYCSDRNRLIPTNLLIFAKYCSHMPLSSGVREGWKYCSCGVNPDWPSNVGQTSL